MLEISTQEDIFRQIVEQVNLEAESDCSPYQDELSEINSRISAVESEIENFFDAIESSGQKIVSLMEKRIEKQQDDLTELEKRKGELEDLVSNLPPKINAQIVLDALKDFSELFSTFRPSEKAEYLQRILKNVIATDKKVSINIFGLTCKPGSKSGLSWLVRPSTEPLVRRYARIDSGSK